jgi:uncharacterized protein YcgL (UPF0745 family)
MYIRKYYELAQRIQEQGGPGAAPALTAQASDLEDNILAQYGLPPSRRFVQILQSIHRYKNLNEQALQKVRERLEAAATGYLLSTPLPDEQLLSQAKRRRLNPYDILPEMGLPAQEYIVFVYNHFCTHRGVHAAQVVQEFGIARERMQDIATLEGKSDPLYKELKARGLRFLDAYLRDRRQSEADPTNRKFMERQLHQLLGKASAAYLKYLQLRSEGMKDAQARRNVGLEDEVFYRIALYTFMLRK